MEIKYTKNRDALTFFVYGELDECSASSAKDILDNIIINNLNAKKVIFDLSGLSFMDSTGIGLLIGRYKKLQSYNVPSYISGASLSAEKVIELAGLYSIMPKYWLGGVMNKNNCVTLNFLSVSENESLARNLAGFFSVQLKPSVAEVLDIKTAVSEAVTNAIVHGYPDKAGNIIMELIREGDVLHINVFDEGIGIENVNKALEPFFTTKENEERSGMGFTIMRSFMDDVRVESSVGKGVKVYMSKKIRSDCVW